MQLDMTKGKPMPVILRFTFPLMIGNMFQQLYNMADTIIVGRYVGADALAAVGSTGTIMFLITGFSQGITSGFSIRVSQRYGARGYGSRTSLNRKRYFSVCSLVPHSDDPVSSEYEAAADHYEHAGEHFRRCLYLYYCYQHRYRSKCLLQPVFRISASGRKQSDSSVFSYIFRLSQCRT